MSESRICWRVNVSGERAPREGYILTYAPSAYAAMRKIAERGLHIVSANKANGTDVWPNDPKLAAQFDDRANG